MSDDRTRDFGLHTEQRALPSIESVFRDELLQQYGYRTSRYSYCTEDTHRTADASKDPQPHLRLVVSSTPGASLNGQKG